MITRDQIVELFSAQLERIEDATLREQVVDTWLLGCTEGSFDELADLHAMPFSLLTDCRGLSFIEHTIAVTEGAVALALTQQKAYGTMPYVVDMDRLLAGGLLHDVGKLLEIEPDGQGGYRKSYTGACARHPISGAMLAARVGLPWAVVNCIGAHAKEGDGRPQTLETVLIHQADFATFNPLVMLTKGLLIVPQGDQR